MKPHNEPNVNGMGAFEGVQSTLLMKQRNAKLARLALEALDDEALSTVISEVLRDRPWPVAQRALQAVVK